jgi:hypothetical protein
MNSSNIDLAIANSAELSPVQSPDLSGGGRFNNALQLIKLCNLVMPNPPTPPPEYQLEAKYGQSPLVKVDEEENSESCGNEGSSEYGLPITDRMSQDKLAITLETRLLNELRDRACAVNSAS